MVIWTRFMNMVLKSFVGIIEFFSRFAVEKLDRVLLDCGR